VERLAGILLFQVPPPFADAGINGQKQLKKNKQECNKWYSLFQHQRYVLSFAALGLVCRSLVLDSSNPPASVFKYAAGEIGFPHFWCVLWSAAISSVLGQLIHRFFS